MFIVNFMLYPPGIQHEARFSVFQWDAVLDEMLNENKFIAVKVH